MASPHDVLGVRPGADAATLHSAYRRLAKRLHPDMPEGSVERFRRLAEAYAALASAPAPQSALAGPAVALPRRRYWLNLVLCAVCVWLLFALGKWGPQEPMRGGVLLADDILFYSLLILVWRFWVERKRPFRNPLLHLRDGWLMFGAMLLLLAFRFACLIAMGALASGAILGALWAWDHLAR